MQPTLLNPASFNLIIQFENYYSLHLQKIKPFSGISKLQISAIPDRAKA